MGKGGKWVGFQYERLPNLCYRCGILSHVQRNCSATETTKQRILGDLYGPWLKAEVEAALLFREGEEGLRRVENKKNEHFDNFSSDINTDNINGEEEDRIQSGEETARDEAEGIGAEMEVEGTNSETLSEINVMSHQKTKVSKESTVGEERLPTEMVIGEGLKTPLEPELNKKQKLESVGKTNARVEPEMNKSENAEVSGICGMHADQFGGVGLN